MKLSLGVCVLSLAMMATTMSCAGPGGGAQPAVGSLSSYVPAAEPARTASALDRVPAAEAARPAPAPEPPPVVVGCTQAPDSGGCDEPRPLLAAAPMRPGGGSLIAAPQPQRGSVDLDVALSHPKVLAGTYTPVWLNVGIHAADARPAHRLPLNVALVIDRSGSMKGKKIKDVRKAAHGLADQLAADDRVTVVSYSDYARADVPSTLVDDAARKKIRRAIDRMRAAGNTFLAAGLLEGSAQVQQHLRRSQVNRVLLLSDGIANRGITDPPTLAGITREMSQRGVLVTTIGVGNDYNEDLMTALADYGGGAYYYVRNSRDLASVVEREAQMMASTVAQRMTVEIELPPGVSLANLFGYTYSQEGNTIVVPVAEAFAGQRRDMLVQLRVPALEEGPLPVASVRLSYEDVTSKEPERRDRAVALETIVTRDRWAVEDAVDREVMARLQEIRIAKALNEAAEAIHAGDRTRAQRVLNTARDEAVQANKAFANDKLGDSIDALGGVMTELDAAPASAPASKALMKRAKESSYNMAK